jgi:hypothetical protein
LFRGWLVTEHEDVHERGNAEVNGAARITANPPNSTPTGDRLERDEGDTNAPTRSQDFRR